MFIGSNGTCCSITLRVVDKRHPNEMGEKEIETFLTHLATTKRVAASTQNQAFSALLFLYRNVLKKDLPHSIDAVRAKRSKHLPTVLTKAEVQKSSCTAADYEFPNA